MILSGSSMYDFIRNLEVTDRDPFLYSPDGKPGGHLPVPTPNGVSSAGNRHEAEHAEQEGVEAVAGDLTKVGFVPLARDGWHVHRLPDGKMATHKHIFDPSALSRGHDHADINQIVTASPDTENEKQVQAEMQDSLINAIVLEQRTDFVAALKMASKMRPDLFLEKPDVEPRSSGEFYSHESAIKLGEIQNRQDEVVANIMQHQRVDYTDALRIAARENRELFLAHGR